MATIINQFEVESPFGDNFTYTITPPSGYALSTIKLITASGAITDIPVTNINGQTVTIPNLREKHRFEICLIPVPDLHFISLHFRGEKRAYVLQETSKLQGLVSFNIFNNATGLQYQYAPAHNVTDWTSYPFRTLAQLQSDINSGPSTYSIRVSISGYAVNSDAGIVLQHNVVGAPPPTVTTLTGISQDVIVWHTRRVTYNSVTASPTATLAYNLITSTGTSLVEAPFANLTALNSAISALAIDAQFGVQIFVNYTGTNTSATLTINTTIAP
jgi:hypothetical protein